MSAGVKVSQAKRQPLLLDQYFSVLHLSAARWLAEAKRHERGSNLPPRVLWMCPLGEAKSIFSTFRRGRIKSYLCHGRWSAGERSAVTARNKKKGVLSSLSLNF